MSLDKLRSMREVMEVYNKLSEECFLKCIDNTNSRQLDRNEIDCVEKCSMKFLNYSAIFTPHFVVMQSAMMNKRVQEVMELAEKANQINEQQQNIELKS